MNIKHWILSPLVAAVAALFLPFPVEASTNDRDYKMGESEGGSNGQAVPSSGTYDDDAGLSGQNQLIDLIPDGGPVYRTITGRPDGVGGIGIEFNAAQSQYLHNFRLGLPETSYSSIGGSGTIDYTGINNRGLQFWVRPSSTAAQTLVMDTNQHGARIDADGNFSMRYDDEDFASILAVVPSTWYHVMVVRPEGAANGSRMYVDGIAVAAAPDGYDGTDDADLVVGANTAGDGDEETGEGFTGGTEEFFSGIIDDLTLFVIGSNGTEDFGAFNFATDNLFAAWDLTGVAGDVNNDGLLNQADKDDFIAGWMNENLVNEIRVGDLNSLGDGDLNFNGITDIYDLALMQNALTSAGLAAITGAELTGVPEPASGLLLLAAALLVPAGRRRLVR